MLVFPLSKPVGLPFVPERAMTITESMALPVEDRRVYWVGQWAVRLPCV
jgi:hypothetical protein